MFNPNRRPSDLDSVSSATSDVTSRATTIQNSWSATTLQEKLRQLSQYNIRPIDDDQSSVSTDTTAREMPIINKNNDIQRNNINQPNSVNTINHHQQQQSQPWVNPYWGTKSNSGTPTPTTGPPETNYRDNNTAADSSSQKLVKQLIPGSILINDQGEIDDIQWKKNADLNSSTSSASFTPGGEYVSDEGGGAGGYLAPTHIQRRSATSSTGQTVQSGNRNSSNKKQENPSNTTINTTQPWVNPYWPSSNQNKADRAQTNDAKPNSGTKSPVYVNTSSKATTTPTDKRQNPYPISNNKSNKKTSSTKSSSFSPKIPPIPSFYERIYPPPSPILSMTNIKHESTPSVRKSEAHIRDNDDNDDDDDDDLTYTFDSPNVVRYRPASTAPNITNKTFNITSTSANAQYPVSSRPKSSFSSYPSTTYASTPSFSTNILPTLFPNVNGYSSSALQYDIPSISKSATVFTESDIHSIHEALRLLQTNPNAIPVIETSNRMASPSSTINHRSNHLSSFTSSPQPQSSFPTRNVQFSSQQAPLFSMPSYPGTARRPLHQLTQQGTAVLI